MKTCFAALSLITASLLSAQQPATPAPAPAPRPHRAPNGDFDQMFEQRLATRLSLNATQQNAVHTSRMEEKTQMKGMMQQRQTLHASMNAAIKAGNSDQIEALSQQLGALHQQETAIHSKTTAKIYSMLNAEQKTKVGDRLEMLGGPGGFRMGPGPMRGHRPAQAAAAQN